MRQRLLHTMKRVFQSRGFHSSRILLEEQLVQQSHLRRHRASMKILLP